MGRPRRQPAEFHNGDLLEVTDHGRTFRAVFEHYTVDVIHHRAMLSVRAAYGVRHIVEPSTVRRLGKD